MREILKPANLSLTWGSAGDILNPGDSKYASGWAVEIPARQWFNYLDNRQDEAIAHINQRGVAQWDAQTEYQGTKSYAQGTTGTIYRSKQTSINQDPDADVGEVYWEIAFASAGDFYIKTEADGLYLANAQNLADLANTATARTNLSVYSQAQTYTKTEVDAKTTVASTAQAQACTSNNTLITPLRTQEWANAKVIGFGQTWQDVKSSRAFDTNYTNTTGRPITVSISVAATTSGTGAGAGATLIVSGLVVSKTIIPTGLDAATRLGASAIIPPGATYSAVRYDPSDFIDVWVELR